jgi:enterochelin esterase-like enzyme
MPTDPFPMKIPSAVRRSALLLAAGAGLLLPACGLAGWSDKRARMATALPSPTITPLAAPLLPGATLPPLSETPVPESVLDCGERAGTLEPAGIPGTVSAQPVSFSIYLPPCYGADETKRYPVLFLFHGLDRTPDQWHLLGLEPTADHLILIGRIPPLLIVLPSVSGGDADDAAFLADLLPAVELEYRTLADREHRAIGGVSRGAEWALRLALRRADLFGAVGAHSISPGPTALADIYVWAQAVPEDLWPRMYFDAGYSDPQLPQMLGILQVLDLLERPYERRIPPGDHSDSYWSGQLRDYLIWYAGGWVNKNAPAEE